LMGGVIILVLKIEVLYNRAARSSTEVF
jgi:hypothetical protein